MNKEGHYIRMKASPEKIAQYPVSMLQTSPWVHLMMLAGKAIYYLGLHSHVIIL